MTRQATSTGNGGDKQRCLERPAPICYIRYVDIQFDIRRSDVGEDSR